MIFMKIVRLTILALILCLSPLLAAGCWNYREIDELAVVAGVAVDKANNGNYIITSEVIQIGNEKDAKIMSKKITIEGNTVFDAVRNGISLTGKKLYWSHAKIVIVSEEIAQKGLSKIVDWYNRDAETRTDVHIAVSKGVPAKEVLNSRGILEEIVSFQIDNMLKNQNSLSKAPDTEIWRFINDLQAKGVAAVTPSIEVVQTGGEKMPQVMGAAVFKKDKLIGFLDGTDTKNMLFIKDEVKGGLLVLGENDLKVPVSLEIFKSETEVEPVVYGDKIEMNINIEVTTAIDEIGGSKNYIEESGRKNLELIAAKSLKAGIEDTIEKVQSDYGVDVFGFGAKVREDKPEVWSAVGEEWENYFKNLRINIKTRVHIRDSAMTSKPLTIGD